MITLTLPVGDIPCNYEARKPTGEKLYVVKRSIKIYGENRKEIIPDEDLVFIVPQEGGGDPSCVRQDKLMSLDLEYDEAIEFIEELRDKEEAENSK